MLKIKKEEVVKLKAYWFYKFKKKNIRIQVV